jgi:hypothetical protein
MEVRVSRETLAGCQDFLDITTGTHEDCEDAGEIVSKALEMLIESLRAAEQIPPYDPPKPVENEHDQESLLEYIREQALRLEEELEAKTSPAVEKEVEITEADEIEKPIFDIFKLRRDKFEWLQKQAPKDILLAEEPVDAIHKAAVEAIYSGLPISMWGSPKAVEMVNQLAGRHNPGEENA